MKQTKKGKGEENKKERKEEEDERDLGLVYSTASRCIILLSHSGLRSDTHALLTNMHSFPKKPERMAQ
ncbi:Uncharacterized protein APZ42_019353 [Daphnia magna]|uniref:Uncharacterized protein n=1 Tax=Daphnia magna TaxID=35525 RepID=A0A162CP56_9CRUS|nr:Uncharacterized protein APZ42_019353 [Daphnia magna]